MRKLASIQKILKVTPIEGADKIELSHVLGWQVVTKKGEFKEGDYCVYFEVDSFLPEDPRFEFLRASSFKKSELLGEGFRLRTAKLRGQISQGLCLPTETFPELSGETLYEGMDVTERLGVRKWEVPEMATTGGTVIGTLPWFIPHSDETRIQSEPGLLHEFGDAEYYISTKMDGSSHAIGIDEDGTFYVCGHNYIYKDDGKSSFHEFVNRRGYEEKLRKYKEKYGIANIAVVGEFCGAGIQKNRLQLKTPEWFVFTVQEDGVRVPLKRALETAKEIEAVFVPVEETGTNLAEKYPDTDALLVRAEGTYPNGGLKEGIVIRPTETVQSKILNGPLSFKVINNRFLLKNE